MPERRETEIRRFSALRLCLYVGAVSILTPAVAHAYIDPLSGSLVLQAVLAGVLGAVVTMGRIGSVMRQGLARMWRRLTE